MVLDEFEEFYLVEGVVVPSEVLLAPLYDIILGCSEPTSTV